MFLNNIIFFIVLKELDKDANESTPMLLYLLDNQLTF